MRILIFTFLFSSIHLAGFSQIKLITSAKNDSIENYILYLEKQNELIGSIAIFENGQASYKRDFGQADKGTTPQKQGEIKYQVGSISKLFTAVMLAQLQEKGEISFDEPLSNYFEEMPNANKIILRQMLNHTSGMKDYTVKNDTSFYWLLQPQTQEVILREIQRQGVAFEPSDSVSYSNSAFYLLARILEKKYKKDYAGILNQQIAKPLGLGHTSASSISKPSNSETQSYKKTDNIWRKIDDFYFLNVSGVGDIVSTTADLNIFINALKEGKIINKESFKALQPEEKKYFGLGIMKIPFYEQIGFGHGGDTYGTHCVVSIFPNENISIAYCVNGESYLTNDFAKDVLSILFNKKFDYPNFSKATNDTSKFSMMVGTYGSKDYPINLKIFNEGNLLKAQGDGQASFDLTPSGTDTYEFRQAKIVIQFNVDKKSLTITQAGQSSVLDKIVDVLITPNSKIDVAKNFLYKGRYKSNDFPLAIQVFLVDGILNAQADGQSAFPLTNISENEFEFKQAGIIIIFNKELNGMILRQGGREYNFNKEK